MYIESYLKLNKRKLLKDDELMIINIKIYKSLIGNNNIKKKFKNSKHCGRFKTTIKKPQQQQLNTTTIVCKAV